MSRLTLSKKERQRQGSFTLIETVLALSLMAFLILEVSAVQGNAIVFSDYGENVTRASYLARRIMAQVEYYYNKKPLDELKASVEQEEFEGFEDFAYSLEIKKWEFPFTKLMQAAMSGGLQQGGEEEEQESGYGSEEGGGMSQLIESYTDQIFGDEPIFMTAHVEVSWAEGSERNSTGLTYLLTNQKKLGQAVKSPPMRQTYKKLTKSNEDEKPEDGENGDKGDNENGRGQNRGDGGETDQPPP